LYATTPNDGGSLIAIETATGRADVRLRGLTNFPSGQRYGTVLGILITGDSR